ncbi:alpha/beta hydrolase [Pendulispora albinea]|uniref:Esterase family protein n=1 Tax=Pendulispora albinea TaxID=2741071 RepID=A0ABZ2LWA3_9BACT
MTRWRPGLPCALLASACTCTLLASACNGAAGYEAGGTEERWQAADPVVSDDGAIVTVETPIDARTLDLAISSPAMRAVANVRLLLPPGWSRGATQTWPVLYLLHGAHTDHTAWTANSDIAKLSASTGVIVVMPDGGACGQYSDWWNLGGFGPPAWETFHLTELRQILERGFHASTVRAIAGFSMGGFGAMSYAARNPSMFRAAASYSGAVDSLWDGKGGPGITGPMVLTLMSVTCPRYPQWVNLWGDPAVPAERRMWEAHNPASLASRLRGIPLFVASGNGEPGPLAPALFPDIVEQVVYGESRAFVEALEAAGVPVTSDFYGRGTHAWPYWQRELHRSWAMLMSAIGATSAP